MGTRGARVNRRPIGRPPEPEHSIAGALPLCLTPFGAPDEIVDLFRGVPSGPRQFFSDLGGCHWHRSRLDAPPIPCPRLVNLLTLDKIPQLRYMHHSGSRTGPELPMRIPFWGLRSRATRATPPEINLLDPALVQIAVTSKR